MSAAPMQGIAVRADVLERAITVALRRHGASAFAASEVAKALRRAEQIGNSHCGLGHLALDCAQLRSGRVAGRAEPRLHQERPGVVYVEVVEGFAQPASASATAPGGFRPVLGTNPIALSVPDGRAASPSSSTNAPAPPTSVMCARPHNAGSRCLSPDWAVGRDGHPTTDAREALAGALLPAGGGTGYGLALMAEVLASAFTGSAMSLDTPSLAAPEGPPHSLGLFCLVLDPGAITGAQFHHTLGRLQDAIESQPGARLPGRRARAGECLTVDGALWRQALSLARLAPAREA